MANDVETPNEKMSSEDIFNSLKDDEVEDLKLDEDKPEESEEETEDEDSSESEDEESESEDETEEEEEPELEDEDELELTELPLRSEIKKAFPDLLKKFPQLDHLFHRHKAYAEVFPTLASAREAKDNVDRLRGFEQEVLSGNLENIIKSVKTADEGAYNKILDNYLGTLYKVDKGAHLALTNNITKGVLKYIHDQVADARDAETPEGQLRIAVSLVHKALYGKGEIKGPEAVKRETDENPEAKRLQNEKEQFAKERLSNAASEVIGKVERIIGKAITDQVDPKNEIPSYIKGKLTDDIMKAVSKRMESDRAYMSVINRLYQESQAANYSTDSKQRIIKAVLRKAKTILLPVIKAKKAEAMKGLNFRKREKEEVDEESQNTRETRESRNPQKQTINRRDGDRLTMKPGEKARNFLMRD